MDQLFDDVFNFLNNINLFLYDLFTISQKGIQEDLWAFQG